MTQRVALAILLMWLAACGPTADPVIISGPDAGAPATAEQPAAPTPEARIPSEVPRLSESDIAIAEEPGGIVPEGEDIDYQHDPPASGPHYPAVLQYGLYEGEDIHAGYWVHSLKRGAIVILYHCAQPCPDLVQRLGDMLDVFPESKWGNRKIVIVPYRLAQAPLMAVAWNVQMPLDQFDAQALIDFYARHVDRGPEDLP